jgi:MazG family protein
MVRAMASEQRTGTSPGTSGTSPAPASGEGSVAGPPGEAAGASLPRLVDIMDRLLSPTGCPWDREQTLDSLRPFLIEETYEVLDALSRGDVAGHCEELGDLLMQIVFQAALRAAEGAFDIDAVVASISDKLVRRHPHVFGDAAGITTSDQVLAQWDEIKRAEKAAAGPTRPRVLAGVKPGPALARAQKIGSKAGKVGFDWPGWEGSFAKIEEEVREAAEAIRAGDRAAIHHELGDLLLAVVNVARKVGVDAENALIDATARFQRRFEAVEDGLTERGKTPQASTLEEMDALWEAAKRRERQA